MVVEYIRTTVGGRVSSGVEPSGLARRVGQGAIRRGGWQPPQLGKLSAMALQAAKGDEARG